MTGDDDVVTTRPCDERAEHCPCILTGKHTTHRCTHGIIWHLHRGRIAYTAHPSEIRA